MRALAITGPRSHPKQVKNFLEAAAGEITLCESPNESSLSRALQSQEAAIIFGGDGTLHRHLPVLVRSQVPVLIVPTGSGNDFALACGVRSGSDALQLFLKARTGEVRAESADLGEAMLEDGSSHLFACCFNAGLDAEAARRTNLLHPWLKSRGGYFLGGFSTLLTYQPEHLQVQADDQQHEGEMWLATVTNTPTFGGGIPIAPRAKINDGLLECTIVRGSSRLHLIRSYPSILRGEHLALGIVTQQSAAQVKIQGEHPTPIFADGEPLGCLPASILLNKNALQIFRIK